MYPEGFEPDVPDYMPDEEHSDVVQDDEE
ncbi:hypothetical protein Pint_30709 [Pistacia integerrima]|uniref:Uncharacterized protein n=1 Tax=Pistacia integerrima TaxID=434235 RepID=A0ACC0X0L0_9ROSI|nr:hypothetical protein Pint_30709 [Pistacia integerrima]